MIISVIGTGYVGLTIAAVFSQYYEVLCIDQNKDKINQLNNATLPIYEPGLIEIINKSKNNITFTNEYSEKLKLVDIIFITVGTPTLKSGKTDLCQIYNSLNNSLKILSPKALIVIKSTVPPGTNQLLLEHLNKSGFQNDIANNPEFLRQGSGLNDFINPDRIVIGVNTEVSKKLMQEVYRPWKNSKIIITDPVTSELAKQSSNAFLATKLSFINEISDYCSKSNAKIKDLIEIIGSDKRIGPDFLQVSPGFGGSCLPKDTFSLLKIMELANTKSVVIKSVVKYNNKRKYILANKILNILGKKNKTLGVLGICFKAGTDDIRNSISVDIIKYLQKFNTNIKAFDSFITQQGKELLKTISFTVNPEDATKSVDALIIATECEMFKTLDFSKIYQNMNQKIIIDLHNILIDLNLESLGFKYYFIGNL